jgi:hypothetical protein
MPAVVFVAIAVIFLGSAILFVAITEMLLGTALMPLASVCRFVPGSSSLGLGEVGDTAAFDMNFTCKAQGLGRNFGPKNVSPFLAFGRPLWLQHVLRVWPHNTPPSAQLFRNPFAAGRGRRVQAERGSSGVHGFPGEAPLLTAGLMFFFWEGADT